MSDEFVLSLRHCLLPCDDFTAAFLALFNDDMQFTGRFQVNSIGHKAKGDSSC